jgi:hypothetical protein
MNHDEKMETKRRKANFISISLSSSSFCFMREEKPEKGKKARKLSTIVIMNFLANQTTTFDSFHVHSEA